MGSDGRAFEQIVTVSAADIDDLGHVNNAAYVRYAEAVSRAHSSARGLGLDEYRALGVVPVVRRHHITYRRPAGPGETLRVRTRITGMRGPRATRRNEVLRADDDTLLVEIETEWVWIDPERGRLRAVPQEVLRAFGWAETGSSSNRSGEGGG